eukprot:8411728-Lingulodinium_polyedra.AAC.1
MAVTIAVQTRGACRAHHACPPHPARNARSRSRNCSCGRLASLRSRLQPPATARSVPGGKYSSKASTASSCPS